MIVAGYFAGSSYKRLESKLSYASWLLLGCVVVFFVVKYVRRRRAGDDDAGTEAEDADADADASA